MTNTSAAKLPTQSATPETKTKNQLIIDLLSIEDGSTLEEMSTLANWQHHSTRSFMTGLKKKGHIIESDKIDGIRRYRIIPRGDA